jgi:hypothetical protein
VVLKATTEDVATDETVARFTRIAESTTFTTG